MLPISAECTSWSPPMLDMLKYDGFHGYRSAAGSAGIGNSSTAPGVTLGHAFGDPGAECGLTPVDELLGPMQLEPLRALSGQSDGSVRTRPVVPLPSAPTHKSTVVQKTGSRVGDPRAGCGLAPVDEFLEPMQLEPLRTSSYQPDGSVRERPVLNLSPLSDWDTSHTGNISTAGLPIAGHQASSVQERLSRLLSQGTGRSASDPLYASRHIGRTSTSGGEHASKIIDDWKSIVPEEQRLDVDEYPLRIRNTSAILSHHIFARRRADSLRQGQNLEAHKDRLPSPENVDASWSPPPSFLHARPETERPLPPPPLHVAPRPCYEQSSADSPVRVASARGQVQRAASTTQKTGQPAWHDHPRAPESKFKDGAELFQMTATPTRRVMNTISSPVDAFRASTTPSNLEGSAPRGLESPVEIQLVTERAPYAAPLSPRSSPSTDERFPFHGAGAAQPFVRLDNDESADPVCVSCFAPPCVYGGGGFQLRVSAYLHRDRGKVVAAASWKTETIPSVPEAMPSALQQMVTVNLSLPDNVFKIVDPNTKGLLKANIPPEEEKELPANMSKVVHPRMCDSKKTARRHVETKHFTESVPKNMDTGVHDSNEASHHPLSVQDFVWNGNAKNAIFRVACLPEAPVGVVQCGACITQGGRITRLSFCIEVVKIPMVSSPSDTAAVMKLDTIGQKVGPVDAEIVSNELTVSDHVLGRGMRVLPPTPFLLASCVDPGPSVHEWKEHGFRLTVQKGSLHRAIGPIKIQEFFQVVKCEDDSQFYLVKTRVDCQPSGTTFPDNSLLMDFMVKDTPVDKIAQTFQVLVRKGEGNGWRKLKSEVGEDQWGTHMRVAVSDFCFFVCARKIHPSDPARLESCDNRGMIEVRNATGVELYIVLVPVSFSSDRTSRVTYTGSIGVGVAGLTVNAGAGSSNETAEKSYMLPAGLTPDEVSIAAGGKFHFEPPPDATKGKLLIATIAEDSQAGDTVRVVVLHGKFITSIGKRRVILPSFLQSKSQISARLGPDDIPVNMVMIMAGLGSNDGRSTVSSTPMDTFQSSMVSVAPLSTVVSAPVSPPSGSSRRSTSRRCSIS